MLSRITQLGMKKAHISIKSILEGPGFSSPDPRFHLSNSLKTLMNLKSDPFTPEGTSLFQFWRSELSTFHPFHPPQG